MKKIGNTKQLFIKLFCFTILFFMYADFFYRQAIELNNMYIGDLATHIRISLSGSGNNYSLIFLLMKYLYNITHNEKIIALFLSFVIIATIILTYFILEKLIPKASSNKLLILAFFLNITSSISIGASSFQNPSILHNATYLCMKLIGLLIMFVFFRIWTSDSPRIRIKDWLVLSILLALQTGIKPNFIVALIPGILIVFSVELIKSKGKSFKKNLIIFTTTIPSIFVILYQYLILFGQTDTTSSLGFSFGYIIAKYTENPVFSLLQSIAFPLLILLFNHKDLIKDRIYGATWLFWLVSLSEFLFLIEKGPRMNDGNWTWAVPFFLFILFIVSVVKLYQNIHDKNFLKQHKTIKSIYFITSYIVVLLHFICGLIYLIRKFLGA